MKTKNKVVFIPSQTKTGRGHFEKKEEKTLKQLMAENDKSLKENYDSRGYHKVYHEHIFADFGETRGYKAGY